MINCLGNAVPIASRVATVANRGSDLLADARALASGLPSSAPDSPGRPILPGPSTIETRAVSSRAGAEQNVDHLDAISQAQQVTTVDSSALRLALDELVRYWEARWYIL
jgi:hypothetical protein